MFNENIRGIKISILVVGSVAIDSIKTPYGQAGEVLGGSAVHFSIVASYFTKVNLVGVVGKDFSKTYINFLKSKAIGLSGLEISEGKTFRWKGFYTHDLNTANTVYTHLNVFAAFRPRIPEEYRNSKNLFLANIDPQLQMNVLSQMKTRPAVVAADSMNYWISSKRKSLIKLLQNVDIFFANEQEARQLTDEKNIIKAAIKIKSYGPKILIIKKGEHGAILFSKGMPFWAPAQLKEKIADPTGAGDSFAGGFMGYIASHPALTRQNLCKALFYASVMASYNVEDFGPNRFRKLTLKDIKRRYNEFKELSHF